eukprot:Hpha_TRINITY_DN94_c0_g2::TRINITY_DN94_c0_g2_i1::g.110209::m.110209
MSSGVASAGWGKLPVKLAVEERGRIAQAREERWAAQKQLLCGQLAALHEELAESEEERNRLQKERDALQSRLEAAVDDATRSAARARDCEDLSCALKDQLLVAQTKLDEVVEFRLQRERSGKAEDRLREEVVEHRGEASKVREALATVSRKLAQEVEGHQETKRLLQCQLSYAEELFKSNKQLKRRHGDRDEAAHAANAKTERLEREVTELRAELRRKEERGEGIDGELRRLRRDRAETRKALLDAEELGRERELLIRRALEENKSLAALITAAREAAQAQERAATEVAVSARPVGVIATGSVPTKAEAPPPVLENLKEHNSLLMSLLSNMLKQQSIQQRDIERRFEAKVAAADARKAQPHITPP